MSSSSSSSSSSGVIVRALYSWENDYDDDLGDENALPEPFEWLNLIPRPPIGEETVFTACARGDLAALRGLVELNGASIDEQDEFNAVPLYYACLCGHYKVVDYLLCRGARCQVDTFDTTRCLYAALTDDIRKLLILFQAANKQRGPLMAFTFRVFNLKGGYGFPDVTFIIDQTSIQVHRSILSCRCSYFLEKFKGKWKNRSIITLTDPRMSGSALIAVLGYLYTERLLVSPNFLKNVASIARNLGLFTLASFSESEAIKESQKGTSRRVIVHDFGQNYIVGTVPKTETSLRSDFYTNLVHNGVIPSETFCDTRAAGDDLDEDGESILFGKEWKWKESPLFSSSSSSSSLFVFHDTEILVRKRALFRCHKTFLCGRSRYFESLFLHEDKNKSIETNLYQFELMDVSPFVFGVIIEYLYTDVVRSIPTVALALEAMNVADAYLLIDGIKPLLASQAASHISVETLCDIYSAATLFNALKLSEAAAKFAAIEIDKVTTLSDFAKLVMADAAAVKGRQEFDSVPIIDEIRTEIRLLLPNLSQQEERIRRLNVLDNFCIQLGLKMRKIRSD
jgi:ankyrin repeat and BTB/POZ domain-containing protein 1